MRGYWNPQVSYMFRSLRRGETYRFGIILYDKKGRSSGVLHVRDITIDVRDPMFEVISGRLSVKPVGIHFEVANLPQNVVAYEIVRCGKSLSDTQILTQGILSRPIRRWYADETQSGK